MIEEDLKNFLSEWENDSTEIKVHTSGSTGTPKEMMVKKSHMIASAQTTCDTLGLTIDDKALLCMSLQYIAGKMMVVRAQLLGMTLITQEPSGHPLDNLNIIPSFAAMVPLQVYNTLQIPEEKAKLKMIKNLLIGGGSISKDIESELKNFPNAIWSSYGMTETLSHIALRRLNGSKANHYYTAMHGVTLTSNDKDCLIIDAPKILDHPIITNDIVKFKSKNTFELLGRLDNIICSGGIKIQIEKIEKILESYLSSPFAISSIEDPKLGEAMVLILTKSLDISRIKKICKKVLPHYHQPKHYIVTNKIQLTPNGKKDRKQLKYYCKRMLNPAS